MKIGDIVEINNPLRASHGLQFRISEIIWDEGDAEGQIPGLTGIVTKAISYHSYISGQHICIYHKDVIVVKRGRTCEMVLRGGIAGIACAEPTDNKEIFCPEHLALLDEDTKPEPEASPSPNQVYIDHIYERLMQNTTPEERVALAKRLQPSIDCSNKENFTVALKKLNYTEELWKKFSV